MRLGLDETGHRARRLTDRFRAHPNEIKQLGLGQAIVVAHRPAFRVCRVSVRPATNSALTADTPRGSDERREG
jgi:hypothetical protein